MSSVHGPTRSGGPKNSFCSYSLLFLGSFSEIPDSGAGAPKGTVHRCGVWSAPISPVLGPRID